MRHGQSAGNVQFNPAGRPKTEPLTDLGKEQAERLAKFFTELDVKIEAIYTSPYTRALQTATIINAKLDVSMHEDERLGEYYPGDWDGLHEDFFFENFAKIPEVERLTYRPPNGESWLDEAVRFKAVIDRAIDDGHVCVVFVSHYDPIKAIVNYLTKQTPEKWGRPIDCPPGGIVTLVRDDNLWVNIAV